MKENYVIALKKEENWEDFYDHNLPSTAAAAVTPVLSLLASNKLHQMQQQQQ